MATKNNLKLWRRERGWTQKELADQLGTTAATISRTEDGSDPREDLMDRILRHFQRTRSDFYSVGDNQIVPIATHPVRFVSEETPFDPNTVMVPVVDVRVSGGSGTPIPEFVEVLHPISFQLSWIRSMRVKPENLKVISVEGSSMEPVLHNGEKAVIDVSKTRIRDGKVYAIAYNDEARIKRLFLQANGQLRIASDNPDKQRYPDEFIEGDEMNRVKVLGQAIHKMGNGGL